MPASAHNKIISNIYATAIFTGVFIIIFLVLFLLSRTFIRKAKKTAKRSSEEISLQNYSSYSLKKDTGLLKTLLVTGLIFVLTVFFIFLILLSMYFADNFIMGGSLYLIFIIIFLILVITVYVIKSGIINR
ncbi:MAG: hypothetical protein M1308_09845 [Actinobacteria bacterium]|nr:hypothetical protein [Actinomycetota bacterium]